MWGDEVGSIVGDIGTYSCKFGYGGEDHAKSYYPSTVGINNNNNTFIGRENIMLPRSDMELISPYTDGMITNWECMEKLWSYSFNQLNVKSIEHPILASLPITCHSSNNICNNYMKMMFETFQVPCFYLTNDALLNSFAFGRSNSLIVEIGHESVRIVPIYDGYILKQPIEISTIAGKVLTKYTEKCIKDEKKNIEINSLYYHRIKKAGKNLNLTKSYNDYMKMELFKDIKETCCHVAQIKLDEHVIQDNTFERYELPDGKMIELGMDRFKIPELLFNPNLLSIDDIENNQNNKKSLQHMIYDVVQNCDVDIRKELLNNIIICGGGALLHGLKERLYNELIKLFPTTIFKIRILNGDENEKRFSSFIGGSILTSLGTFQQLWISKKQYDENGPDRDTLLKKLNL